MRASAIVLIGFAALSSVCAEDALTPEFMTVQTKEVKEDEDYGSSEPEPKKYDHARFMKDIDTDGDGKFSLEELTNRMEHVNQLDLAVSAKFFQEAHGISTHYSVKEINKYQAQINKPLEDRFHTSDVDQDGSLTWEEFSDKQHEKLYYPDYTEGEDKIVWEVTNMNTRARIAEDKMRFEACDGHDIELSEADGKMNYQESVYMNMAHMPEADRFALEKEVEANLYQFDLNKNSFIDGEELDEAYMFLVDSTHPDHLLEENIDLAKYGQSAEAVSDYDDEEEAEEEDEEEDSEGPTDYKALLTKLYTKHNPEKLAQIDEILEKYAGNEDDIIQGIKEKYEETETTEPAVNEPVWKESAPNELEIMTVFTPEECTEKTKAGDQLSMHYTGTIAQSSATGEQGSKFDSSVGGSPFGFLLGAGEVIQGWDQGLLDMCVGEKRELTIPPHLGYGDNGAGGDIPGGATLHFEVECVSIGGAGEAGDAVPEEQFEEYIPDAGEDADAGEDISSEGEEGEEGEPIEADEGQNKEEL